MLRHWAVREHFVSGSKSQNVLVRLSSNFKHNTSRGSSCALWGYMNFDLLLVQNFVSGADRADRKLLGLCSLWSLVVPFKVFEP